MNKDMRTKLEETSEKNYPMVRQEMAAMLTIEERAKEYRDKRCLRIERLASLENLSNDVRRSMLFHCYEDYKTGASDQKSIDDAELAKLKKAWEKEAEVNHDAKKAYAQGYHDAIDKACEWLEKYMESLGYVDEWCRTGEDKFKKAMEEE